MRPVAVRFNQTQLCEKLLQMIYKCSAHFHQSAVAEYNAPVGSRKHEHAAGTPMAGERNLVSCIQDYQQQWRLAVQQKILTKLKGRADPRHDLSPVHHRCVALQRGAYVSFHR